MTTTHTTPDHQQPGIQQRQPHTFAPKEGVCMACLLEGGQAMLIEPSIEHPGFFFLSSFTDGGMRVDYLTRPIRSDWVEVWLIANGLPDPSAAEWREEPCAGVFKAGQSLHSALEAA